MGFYFFLIGKNSPLKRLLKNHLSPSDDIIQISRICLHSVVRVPLGNMPKAGLSRKICYRVCSVEAPNAALAAEPEEPKLFAGIFWRPRRKDRGPLLSPCPCSGKGWMAEPGHIQGSFATRENKICWKTVPRSHDGTRDAAVMCAG